MFTSSRRVSSVLAALALACISTISSAATACWRGLGTVRDVVLAPFSVKPPRMPQAYPPLTVAPTLRAFTGRMLNRFRPLVSPGWRMCPST